MVAFTYATNSRTMTKFLDRTVSVNEILATVPFMRHEEQEEDFYLS